MKWLPWRRQEPAQPAPEPFDARVNYALSLTNEVSEKIRERSKSIHPFREVLMELLIRPQAVVDVALVADAFEVMQESRIFHGPNGHATRAVRNKIQK